MGFLMKIRIIAAIDKEGNETEGEYLVGTLKMPFLCLLEMFSYRKYFNACKRKSSLFVYFWNYLQAFV